MKNVDEILDELKHGQRMQEYLQKHWWLFLVEGVFFLLLGFAAIVIPQVISVVIVIFMGWLIVLAGVMHLGRSLFFRDFPGLGIWLGLGILQIAVGYLLIADPFAGIVTFTIMIAIFFALEGILKMYLAFKMRPLGQWHGVLISGVTSFFFATTILVFWPEIEHWLLGLLMGINMAILGGSMVIMSLRFKGVKS